MPTAQDQNRSGVMQGRALNSTVIGGAMLPHAPQFFTIPETEDRDTVEISGSSFRMTMPSSSFIRRHRLSRSMSGIRPRACSRAGISRWKVPSEIGLELVRQLYRQGFDPAFTSVAKIDYAMRHPAHPSRRRGSGPADLSQCLPPAPADDGALLCLWPGSRGSFPRWA
jgi:2,3-dihydroxyphenylpropionate 1,2-dioxygenase